MSILRNARNLLYKIRVTNMEASTNFDFFNWNSAIDIYRINNPLECQIHNKFKKGQTEILIFLRPSSSYPHFSNVSLNDESSAPFAAGALLEQLSPSTRFVFIFRDALASRHNQSRVQNQKKCVRSEAAIAAQHSQMYTGKRMQTSELFCWGMSVLWFMEIEILFRKRTNIYLGFPLDVTLRWVMDWSLHRNEGPANWDIL